MNSREIAGRYTPRIEKELKRYLSGQLLSLPAGEQSFLRSERRMILETCLAPAKRLRPIITVMAYRALGGKKENKIMTPALAFELFHNYTLVHDDIYDEDDVRRGKPSYQAAVAKKFRTKISNSEEPTHLFRTPASRFGAVAGFLAGLQLHNLGVETIMGADIRPGRKLEGMKLYSEVSIADNIGQQMDLGFEDVESISEKEYLLLAKTKTGTLLRMSAEWGAVLAGGSTRIQHLLGKYVEDLGQAFQIKDDILDLGIGGSKNRESGSDIRTGKKTLPLIYALKNSGKGDRKILKRTVGNTSSSQAAIRNVIKIFISTGGVRYAEKVAGKIISQADSHFKLIKPYLTREGTAFFGSLPELLWGRNK